MVKLSVFIWIHNECRKWYDEERIHVWVGDNDSWYFNYLFLLLFKSTLWWLSNDSINLHNALTCPRICCDFTVQSISDISLPIFLLWHWIDTKKKLLIDVCVLTPRWFFGLFVCYYCFYLLTYVNLYNLHK